MLVDLDGLRPRNETYEHYLLKQVGRAWLFKGKGMRYIACEVLVQGKDVSPYGYKQIVDVVGIEKKRKQQPSIIKLNQKVNATALLLGEPLGLTEKGWGGSLVWINTRQLRGDLKASKEALIEICYENACEALKLPKDAYKKLKSPYKEEFLLATVEAKWSYEDFKNGFSVSGDHSYLIAPVGVIPLEEIPAKVGLLEFDFDCFHETKDWEKALKVTKKPKKEYDSLFLNEPTNKKSFNVEKHEQFCRELIYAIAQESTEESVFWNPFLRHVPDGGTGNTDVNWRFKYKAGDVTSLGIVIDRRVGNKSKKELEEEEKERLEKLARGEFAPSNRSSITTFYKLVVPNEGITKWISERVITNSL